MSAYRVVAPLVLVRDQAGAFGYFYQGAILPPYVGDEQLVDMLDSGMVIESLASESQTPAASEPKHPKKA